MVVARCWKERRRRLRHGTRAFLLHQLTRHEQARSRAHISAVLSVPPKSRGVCMACALRSFRSRGLAVKCLIFLATPAGLEPATP